MQNTRKNGVIELAFSYDRSQAFATIYPPQKDGEAVTVDEVMQRLKSMGVAYGFRDNAIADAVRHASVKAEVALNILVAAGDIPKDGQDARIRCTLPVELLTAPLPRRSDGSGLMDWFALEPARLVKAGDELATIVPPLPGVPGKTLTKPVTIIASRPGKPAMLSAGPNVRASEDGLRLTAMQDGLAVLNGEQILIHGLREIKGSAEYNTWNFPAGAVCHGDITGAQITAGTFIAVRGMANSSYLRAHGDIALHAAQDCEIAAAGDIHVFGSLRNCQITTRKKVIAWGSATIVGGAIHAFEGVDAATLGAEDFPETSLEIGVNRYAALRTREAQEELAAYEANKERIGQALKPFVTLTVHTNLSDDKRALLLKLQAQQRTQELRIRELHNERRSLLIEGKERFAGAALVSGTIYPGVWIRFGKAEMLVESPMQAVRFVSAAGGKTVQCLPLQAAA